MFFFVYRECMGREMAVEGHRREGNRGGREMGLAEMDIWLLELEIRKLV